MKLLIITRYTKSFASSRYRAYQIGRYFQDNVSVKIIPLMDPGEKNRVKKKIIYLKNFISSRFRIIFSNTIYFHKARFSNWEMKLLKFFGKTIILSIDDLPSQKFINFNCNSVDVVLCGSKYIERMFQKNGFVTKLWVTTFSKKYIRKNNNSFKLNIPPVIAWIGSVGGGRNISKIVSSLDDIYKNQKIELRVITKKIFLKKYPSNLLNKSYFVFKEWELEKEWDYFDGIDILIMPLDNSPESKGKSGFKILQAMARGVPCVCSRTEANELLIKDGYNGFVCNSISEWGEKLKKLLDDKNLRKKFVSNSYDKIKNEGLIFEDKIKEIEKFFKILN